MSLKQIEVTKCDDCPFMNTDYDSVLPFSYECNINSKDIDDEMTTPDWCPLVIDDYIEVSHTDGCKIRRKLITSKANSK